MARRSLQASEDGIKTIRAAMKRKNNKSQKDLSIAAACSRQTIWSLLQGNPVDEETLMAVCNELGLEAEKIAIQGPEPESYKIDELVKEVRSQVQPYIQETCGTMRVLNMTRPIELGDIYTNVNILEKLTRDRQFRIDELLEQSRDKFDQLARGEFIKKGVPGLEAVQKHPKLMVFGKPGAGKTTFLKFLALQCSRGKLFPDLIPLFIPLKEWAEAPGNMGLVEHLINVFASYGIAPNAQVKQGFLGFLMNRDRDSVQQRVNLTAVEQVLRQGRVLMLLDGLDEVREANTKWVVKEIEAFSKQFPKNRYVVTCRIAAKDYVFAKFIEVEVADFNGGQVEMFVHKWFEIKNLPKVAERLNERLKESQPIRELACSPILLTLLCLVFEESGELSLNRADLYKRGLDLLLSRWDATRGIERDQVYRRLSLRAKEEMLSEIAFSYFERSEYFFRRESLTEQITSCLYNLPGAEEDEDLQTTSRSVLRAIESQHGLLVARANEIYSFSHLTFQEYLTARWIEKSRNPIILKDFVTHITEPQWREVFLLTAGMLNREGADELLLLIKLKAETTVTEEKKIQFFLHWLHNKTISVEAPYKPVSILAFYIFVSSHYFPRNLARDKDVFRDLALTISEVLSPDIALEPELSLDLDLARNFAKVNEVTGHLGSISSVVSAIVNARTGAKQIESTLALLDLHTSILDLHQAHTSTLNVIDEANNHSLYKKVKSLIQEVPVIDMSASNEKLYSQLDYYYHWWKENGENWIGNFRKAMIENRNIGQRWDFNTKDLEKFSRYIEINKLLIDCMNSDCYISRDVRKQIEDTLLLPQVEIDKYRAEQGIKE